MNIPVGFLLETTSRPGLKLISWQYGPALQHAFYQGFMFRSVAYSSDCPIVWFILLVEEVVLLLACLFRKHPPKQINTPALKGHLRVQAFADQLDLLDGI